MDVIFVMKMFQCTDFSPSKHDSTWTDDTHLIAAVAAETLVTDVGTRISTLKPAATSTTAPEPGMHTYIFMFLLKRTFLQTMY